MALVHTPHPPTHPPIPPPTHPPAQAIACMAIMVVEIPSVTSHLPIIAVPRLLLERVATVWVWVWVWDQQPHAESPHSSPSPLFLLPAATNECGIFQRIFDAADVWSQTFVVATSVTRSRPLTLVPSASAAQWGFSLHGLPVPTSQILFSSASSFLLLRSRAPIVHLLPASSTLCNFGNVPLPSPPPTHFVLHRIYTYVRTPRPALPPPACISRPRHSPACMHPPEGICACSCRDRGYT